jgi:two-component system copper resistance phosphate regulon response regulator CusR
MKILIVEDEQKTRAYLQKGLAEAGFTVDAVQRGEEALHVLADAHHDLIILDVMLPGLDGWTIVARMRARGDQTPVVMLTARDQVQDRVRGLELGADDYLIKPFAFSELLARVRTVLRRAPTRQPELLMVGDLEINIARMRASRAGRRLDLTPREFALLSLFSQRAGEVLSRTFIAEHVWDMNFDCDSNVVDVHVRRLRAKLDDPFDVKLIRTVRGMGYVLEGPR